jgi:hypothetical protein
MNMREDIAALKTLRAQVHRPVPQSDRHGPFLQIIGGQTINGVDGIGYMADPLPDLSAAYDPDADVTYPVGLGRAWIYNSYGRPGYRVLVRHNWPGNQEFLIQGRIFIAAGSATLTYGAVSMLAYTIRYP